MVSAHPAMLYVSIPAGKPMLCFPRSGPTQCYMYSLHHITPNANMPIPNGRTICPLVSGNATRRPNPNENTPGAWTVIAPSRIVQQRLSYSNPRRTYHIYAPPLGVRVPLPLPLPLPLPCAGGLGGGVGGVWSLLLPRPFSHLPF